MNRFREIYKTRFYRNVIALTSASLISQIIVFAGTPFLTQIFAPEAFGEAAVFMLHVSFFATFISLRMEWSIPSAKSSFHSIYLQFASIKIAFYFSILVMIFFLFDFDVRIFGLLGLAEVPYDFLIAPTAFFVSVIAIVNAYFVRANDLKLVSYSLVVQSISNLIFSIFTALIGLIQTGLILSQALSNFLALIYINHRHFKLFKYFFIKKTKYKYLKIYQNQVMNSLGVSILNFFFQNSFPIVLSINYSTREVGLYYLAMRVAGAPINLISAGLASSFWGEIAELTTKSTKQARTFYLRTTLKLFFLSIPVILLYAVFAKYIHLIFTSEKWLELGSVIIVCLPHLAANFIFSSTNHLIVYNKQHYQLFSDSLSVISTIGVVYASSYYSWTFLFTIFVMSTVTLFSYFIRFLLHLKANSEVQVKNVEI